MAQHDGLKDEDAPRVYNVFRHKDEKLREREFWTAVLRAVNLPMERFVCRMGTRGMLTRGLAGTFWTESLWRA